MESSLRYLAEVVRTGKTEMLSGGATIVLDLVLKLLNCLHEQQMVASGCSATSVDSLSCKQIYSALIRLIKWTDTKLINKAIDAQQVQSFSY